MYKGSFSNPQAFQQAQGQFVVYLFRWCCLEKSILVELKKVGHMANLFTQNNAEMYDTTGHESLRDLFSTSSISLSLILKSLV